MKFIAIIEDAPNGGFTSRIVNTHQIKLNDTTDVLTDLDLCNYAVEQFANIDALTDCVMFNFLSDALAWVSKKISN
jgi:hypothetical protein